MLPPLPSRASLGPPRTLRSVQEMFGRASVVGHWLPMRAPVADRLSPPTNRMGRTLW